MENLVDNTLSKGLKPLFEEKEKFHYGQLIKTVKGKLTADVNNALIEKSNRLVTDEMRGTLKGIIEINIYRSNNIWKIQYKDKGVGFTEEALQNCKRWLEEGPNTKESETNKGFGFWCIGAAVKFADGKYVVEEGKKKQGNRYNPTFIFSFKGE